MLSLIAVSDYCFGLRLGITPSIAYYILSLITVSDYCFGLRLGITPCFAFAFAFLHNPLRSFCFALRPLCRQLEVCIGAGRSWEGKAKENGRGEAP